MVDEPAESVALARDLEQTHDDWLAAIAAAADAVAEAWDGGTTAERTAVVEPFEAALEDRGVIAAVPEILVDLADRAGLELPAPPVADAPYVVVTGEGLVCRATGVERRLVITVGVFAVDPGPPPTYRRAAEPIERVLSVEFRG